MNKILHFGSTFKAKADENGFIKITGHASTSNTDRAGDVILPDAWTKSGGIENFKKNPIILFNHNYDSPIGRATSVTVTDKGLEIDADISSADSKVQQLIKDGVLGTFSVGFMVKDADYIEETDGFLIKDAELFEVSVVSVPCNQDATFSLAKSFDNENEYKEYIKQFTNTAEPTEEELAIAKTLADEKAAEDAKKALKQENKMDPEELKALLKKTAEDAAAGVTASIKAEADAKAKATADAAEKAASFKIEVKTAAESLLEDIEKRFNEKNADLNTIVGELKEELTSKSAEIDAIRTSKRNFADRSGIKGDWKKEFSEEITDKYLLGLATGKGWDTKAGQHLIKVVSDTSGVEVSSVDFEQIVSTSIERDIQLELVLADMFRELPMTSNTMILPVMPDAGYAQFVGRNAGNGTQTSPKGNLQARGDTFGTPWNGVDLGERTITTSRLMSTSYLGNETEEDAILPVLGLIRESMVRSHARSIEQAILLGNNAQGVYTANVFDGLAQSSISSSTNLNAGAGYLIGDVVTALELFQMRKAMGKYGMRPDDVVYIVSQDAYFNLIEDADFEDIQQVGELAMKVKGAVGRVYGTQVIVCDEFPTKTNAAYNAICVNTRNYLMPRLRGMTVESEYSVKDQQRVLVASQRVGFLDIIEDVTSVASNAYKLTV